jgi:hypothetical protein
MLVNENRLNLADARARQYLARQMENHFFGAAPMPQPALCRPPARSNCSVPNAVRWALREDPPQRFRPWGFLLPAPASRFPAPTPLQPLRCTKAPRIAAFCGRARQLHSRPPPKAQTPIIAQADVPQQRFANWRAARATRPGSPKGQVPQHRAARTQLSGTKDSGRGAPGHGQHPCLVFSRMGRHASICFPAGIVPAVQSHRHAGDLPGRHHGRSHVRRTGGRPPQHGHLWRGRDRLRHRPGRRHHPRHGAGPLPHWLDAAPRICVPGDPPAC